MKRKYWIFWSGAGAALVALGYLAYTLQSDVPVRAVRTEKATIRQFVDEQAKTRLPHTYVVSMPLSGRLAAEPIAQMREGTRVREGEVVARLVAEDLDIAVREARARVARLDAAVLENANVGVEQTAAQEAQKMADAVAEATKAVAARIEASCTNLEYARAHLARTLELRRTNARTEDEYELAIVQHAEAAATYRQDQLAYAAMLAMQAATDLMPEMVRQYIERKLGEGAKVLQRQRDEMQAVLDRALKDQQRGILQSPIDGIVLAQQADNERFVAAGEVLLEIGRIEDIQIEADLLTIDAVDVAPGDSVEIYGPAVGETPAHGTVAQVYPAGFTKLSSLGVEQQRVKVVVAIDPADRIRLIDKRRMAVGYRVRIRITTATKQDALVLPRTALFRGSDGRWRVFAIRDGAAREQVVQLGLANDQQAEVTAGLEPGEMVVDVPDSSLEDGVRVTVQSE